MKTDSSNAHNSSKTTSKQPVESSENLQLLKQPASTDVGISSKSKRKVESSPQYRSARREVNKRIMRARKIAVK